MQQLTYNVNEPFPYRRLSAGQPDFGNAVPDEERRKPHDFVIAKDMLPGREFDAVAGHAVKTCARAPRRERQRRRR